MANPTLFLNGQQFHQIYRNCFDGLNAFDRLNIRNDTLYREVQNELPNLILADSEEKMLSIAKKIRTLFAEQDGPAIGMLKQFQSFSESVKNGSQFWGCFSPSLPIDSKPIQNLIIQRFKNLPEDFKTALKAKSMDWNEKSVRICLADAEFFIKKENKVQNPLKDKQNEIHYLKQGEEMQSDFLDSQKFNLYSDKCIDQTSKKRPIVGQQLKDLRTYWVEEARAGRLVMEGVRVLPNGLVERIALDKNIKNYVDGYKITMNFLVYHEMVSGNIHSMEEAFAFINQQTQTNLLFLSAYINVGDLASALPMAYQLTVAEDFEELLPATEDTKRAIQQIKQQFANKH